MITFLIILVTFVLAVALLVFGIWHPIRLVFRGWSTWGSGRRLIALTLFVTIFSLPVLGFKIFEYRRLLSLAPAPLRVAQVEYQLEESWGIGGPGDNETGFIVYRLTEDSVRWARSKGASLSLSLPGGREAWQSTPINDMSKRWHPYDDDRSMGPKGPHPTNLAEYLDKYGFSIPIEKERLMEVDEAIQNEGSLYSYSRGGGVTIVDLVHGKVYFAYAG